MKYRVCGIISLVLALSQVLVILASWIITAAMPELPMRSLLGSEGFRWFFGHFTENLNISLLVDIVLLMIGCGAVVYSGLPIAIGRLRQRRRISYLDRVGLCTVGIEFFIFIIVIILLTAVPHAILQSVAGHLFPSSFSQSLVPIISFILLVCSLSFGLVSTRLQSLASVFKAMTYGVESCAWLFPIYVLAIELYCSIRFILL